MGGGRGMVTLPGRGAGVGWLSNHPQANYNYRYCQITTKMLFAISWTLNPKPVPWTPHALFQHPPPLAPPKPVPWTPHALFQHPPPLAPPKPVPWTP